MPSRDRKALLASAAIVGAAVLACAAVVGRYRQQKTELEQFLLVPMNGPMLFSHPGGEPRRPRAFSLLLGRPAACPARLHAPCMHHDRRHQLASRARWRCVLATYESCGAGAGRLPRVLHASYASRHSAQARILTPLVLTSQACRATAIRAVPTTWRTTRTRMAEATCPGPTVMSLARRAPGVPRA